jgi:hypothetical protein
VPGISLTDFRDNPKPIACHLQLEHLLTVELFQFQVAGNLDPQKIDEMLLMTVECIIFVAQWRRNDW